MTRKQSALGWMALCFGVAVALSAAADAAEPVRDISWSELKEADRLPVGEVIVEPGAEPAEWLRITRDEDDPRTIELLVLEEPGVKPPGYALRGKIRYEGVEPPGYLEMWNHFADGKQYFTRTLSEEGPTGKQAGTSAWRDLEVPFFPIRPSGEYTDPPTKLVLNLVLPGEGIVEISSLQLVQYTEKEVRDFMAPAFGSGLRTDREEFAGRIGAVTGALLGLSGGAVGILCGFGRARSFVLALMTGWVAVGLLLVGMASVCWLAGRPNAEFFPLLQVGTLATLLCGGLLPVVSRNYRQQEFRRMQAFDAV